MRGALSGGEGKCACDLKRSESIRENRTSEGRIVYGGRNKKDVLPASVSAIDIFRNSVGESPFIFLNARFTKCAPDTFLASGLQSVRFYLDAGIIGKPFFATANMTNFGVETWHPKPHAFYEKGSGPLFDMGPYYVSALVSLLGPVESVGAFGTKASPVRHIYVGEHAGENIPVEENTTFCAILRLRSGVTVNLNITYDIYKSGLPAFEIYGDGGTLAYPDPNFGGGTPKVYRKEQYTDVCYRDDEEAQKRKQSYYELPEVFTRFKDYSRGIGVQDLAAAIESGTKNRANGELILHVTEVLQAIRESAEQGQFICLKTTCERPEPLIPGSYLDQI